MSNFIRQISAVASIAIAATAGAQSVEQAGQAGTPVFADCQRDVKTAGAFEHCALSIDRFRLRRVNSGAVISERGILEPIALTHFVAGDSALHLANVYERRTRLGMRLEILGAVLAATSYMATRICNTDKCPSNPTPALRNSIIGGAAMFAIGVPIQIRARRQGRMAVSLYNASLAH